MASICCSPPDSEPRLLVEPFAEPREQRQGPLEVLGALRVVSA